MTEVESASRLMSRGLARLNGLSGDDAAVELARCCGSEAWVATMMRLRPYATREDVLAAANAAADGLTREDWLEAFSHHPRLGETALRQRFMGTASWATSEQSGVRGASDAVIGALAAGNAAYEQRFGHVFLLCATGVGADAMLAAQRERAGNDALTELKIAAGEQRKITALRIDKLLTGLGEALS